MKFLGKSIIYTTLICIISCSFLNFRAFSAEKGLTLPTITAQMLKNDLEPVVEKGHPYILANKDNFDRVRQYAFGRDKVITNQYRLIKSRAAALLDKPKLYIDRDITNSSYIGTAIEFWNNIMDLAFVWQIEREDAYAQYAWEQTKIFCDMKTWGEYQLIDNVQTAFGVTLCYDWLYDWLSQSQRNYLVNALRKHHLNTVSDVYNNPGKSEYQITFYLWLFSNNNHTLMDNSITFLSAMAIADTDIDFCVDVMDHALENLEPCFNSWYPDSAWYEGLGYWGWAGPYMARLFLTMKNSFGHCYGYEDIECLMKASDFPIYAQSSQGGFVWNDTGLFVDQKTPIIYSFGVLKNDVALQTYALENTDIQNTGDAVFCLEYNPKTNYGSKINLELDKQFRNTDMVTMRNSFDTNQEIWCGMAVQESRSNNGMMNSGTVALDALGERWITNHGKEEYYDGYWDQNGRRWQYYRTRAEANSCIVIDPSEHGGQNVDSKDTIDTFVSGENSAYAISDLTETYSDNWKMQSYKRGISLLNNRRTFVVQDEISLLTRSEIYSFFNIYDADIEILKDGKSAIVSKGDKKLYVEVYSDKNFEFSVMDCEPLPTSPTPEYPNSDNSDFKKLAIHFGAVSSANIRVTFTPCICDEELQSIVQPEFTPMSEWTLEESKPIPKLTDLRLNGRTIEGFSPDTRYYKVTNNFPFVSPLAYVDQNKYTAETTKKGNVYEIKVSDKADLSNVNFYVVDTSGKTHISTPQTTYTHSSFSGVMTPQENYRMQNGKEKSVLYIKDTAPQNTSRAVLTLSMKCHGKSVVAKLDACLIEWEKELFRLSGRKSPVDTKEGFTESLSPSMPSVFDDEYVEISYDITELIPDDGGDFTIAMLPHNVEDDFLSVASPLNSDCELRPEIIYYYE